MQGAPPCVLGVPGSYVAAGAPLDHCTTKVGGAPAWPAWLESPPAWPACSACGRELLFLLQAYAPTPGLDRALYVFTCAEEACSREARTWRAFRTARGGAGARDGNTAKPPAGGGDSAGFGEDWGGEAACSDGGAAAADLEALVAGLERRAEAGGTGGAGVGAGAETPTFFQDDWLNGTKEDGRAGPAADRRPAGRGGLKPLPEFYLCAVCEPAAGRRRLDAHVEGLLRAYEAEHGPVGGGGGPAPPGPARPEPAEAWDEEDYEEDADADALLAFQERLARCPEQCARHGGPACWPGRAPPRFPACPACGGARAAELVLTPGLHAALLEGEGAEFAGGWTAAAIGACRACGGWAEEAVAVACVE